MRFMQWAPASRLLCVASIVISPQSCLAAAVLIKAGVTPHELS